MEILESMVHNLFDLTPQIRALITLNEERKCFMKVVKSLGESGLFIKGTIKKLKKNKIK